MQDKGAILSELRDGGGRWCACASRARLAAGFAAMLLLSGCAPLAAPPATPSPSSPDRIDVSVYQKAADERSTRPCTLLRMPRS